MRCYYCLSTDGEVARYSSEESGLVPGDYHEDCAQAVGYNEWDKED